MTLNIGQMVATTISNYPDSFQDAASNDIVLYSVVKEKGNIEKKVGGLDAIEPFIYNATSSYQRKAGMSRVDLAEKQQIDGFRFPWKKAIVPLVISGSDVRMNQGSDEQILDFVEAKMKATTSDLVNGFEVDLASAGLLADQITGIQGHFPDDPTTGVIGGVSRSNLLARSQKFSGTTDGGAAVSAANIRGYISRLVDRCTRNKDRPDMAFADRNYFGLLRDNVQSMERTMAEGDDTVKAGFRYIYVDGVRVYAMAGYNNAGVANHIYLLDSGSLKIKFLKGAALEVLGSKEREPIDADGYATLLGFEGAFTCNRYFTNGVLIA